MCRQPSPRRRSSGSADMATSTMPPLRDSSLAVCGAGATAGDAPTRSCVPGGLQTQLPSEALDEAYAEEDEAALARDALGSRSVADDAARRRAIAFLSRRGFSAGAVWAAIRRAAEEE